MSKLEDWKNSRQHEYEKNLATYNKLVAEGKDVSFCHCKTVERYKEILKLDQLLTKANIKHLLARFLDGWQVVVFSEDEETKLCDAVEHFASYGEKDDKLEISGGLTDKELSGDSVLCYLSAEDCAKRFIYCYKHNTSAYAEDEQAANNEKIDDAKEIQQYCIDFKKKYDCDAKSALSNIDEVASDHDKVIVMKHGGVVFISIDRLLNCSICDLMKNLLKAKDMIDKQLAKEAEAKKGESK